MWILTSFVTSLIQQLIETGSLRPLIHAPEICSKNRCHRPWCQIQAPVFRADAWLLTLTHKHKLPVGILPDLQLDWSWGRSWNEYITRLRGQIKVTKKFTCEGIVKLCNLCMWWRRTVLHILKCLVPYLELNMLPRVWWVRLPVDDTTGAALDGKNASPSITYHQRWTPLFRV